MLVSELLGIVSRHLDQLQIPYFVTGSVAGIVYGEARFTNDIDIVMDIRSDQVDAFCRGFNAEYYVSPNAIRDAISQRFQFNIIHTISGLKVDCIIPGHSAYELGRMQRSRLIPSVENQLVRYSSPEDLILKKLEFYREGGSDKHLRDIDGIIRIQDALEWDYLNNWAKQIGVDAILNELVSKHKPS